MPPDYLHDRGLADASPAPPPAAPFPFAADGTPVPPAVSEVPVVAAELPDDYAARLVALEWGKGLLHDDILLAQDATRWAHAFLTNTEPKPPRQATHTDD